MRLLYLSFLTIIIGYTAPLYAQDFQRSVITDPSITRRCEGLLEERHEKIRHKQRLDSLLLRNQKVQSLTPDNKQTLQRRLRNHHSRVQQEQRMALIQIQQLEENIVRQGCPGIRL